MKRRTFLQGLLVLPLIGVAAKAFSAEKSYSGTITGRFSASGPNIENIPKTREVSHVLFFDKDKIKERGWVDMAPIMVMYDRKILPLLVTLESTAIIDMEAMKVIKHRTLDVKALTEKEHEQMAFTSYGRAFFHVGDKGPYELTDEIRVKNNLAFANLREARTGEML